MPDLIERISELAGDKVAETIASEFGGMQHYVRVCVALPPGKVCCRECVHIKKVPNGTWPGFKCGITDRTTNEWHRRTCPDFLQRAFKPCEPGATKDAEAAIRRDFNGFNLEALAAHHGISIQQAYQAAVSHKPQEA